MLEPMTEPEQPYKVKLDNLFEGPMDLLIHLIKKNEMDIYDIPIAVITQQYIEYLEWLQMMNIDFAGDFLVMAATLTQIKSRMLLPVHEMDGDEEDPRMEIAKPLQEYLEMKSVAEQLAERDLLGDTTFIRSYSKEAFDEYQEGDPVIQVGLFELIDAFQKILDSIPEAHRIDMNSDTISVKEKISEIVDILDKQSSITFYELFSAQAGKSEIIITFLALLEMVKLSLIRVIQHVPSGIIRIFYV